MNGADEPEDQWADFYYCVVKGTPYKWVDFAELARILLPHEEIGLIKQFTAQYPGDETMRRQNVFLQGVDYETITAPDGWRDPLIEYSNDNTDGVTELCLEINDLWLTKLADGRPKDFEFCRALVRAKLITADIVQSRTATIDPRVDSEVLSVRVERLLGDTDSA